MNVALSQLWFWSSYLVVTLLGLSVSLIHIRLLGHTHRVNFRGRVVPVEPYRFWLPFRPLLTAVIWTVCAVLYFHMSRPVNLWVDTVALCISWTLLSIVADLLLWVVWRHPWSLRPKQMYLYSLPWLLLSYAVSAGAVLLGGLLYSGGG